MKTSVFSISVLATVLILGSASAAWAQEATNLNGPMQAQDMAAPMPTDNPATATAPAPANNPATAAVDEGPETIAGTGQEITAGTGTDATLDVQPDQAAARGMTVTQRNHPEYTPQGTRLGSFRLLPDISLNELFNDNIYAVHNHKTSDWTTVVEPRLALRSNWHQHALNFLAADAEGIYASHSHENYSDYLLQSDGRLDITRHTRLAGLVSYAQEHEDRSDPNSPNSVFEQTKPVVFQVRTLQAEAFHEFNRIKLDAIYSNQNFSYNNGDLISGGGRAINSDRNRMDNSITGRVAYELTPTEDVYVQSSYNVRSYDHRDIFDGVYRDSDGYNIFGGLRADVTGKIFGDIYAGYLHQNYDSSLYKDYSGVGFGMNGYWNFTQIDTLTINVGRAVEETIIAGSSSYVESRFRMDWDHELRRNWLLTTEAGYDRDEFQGIGRKDNVYVVGGGLKYLVNSHFNLYANYDYVDRDSNQTVNSYTQNRFLVGVKAAL